MSGLQFLVSIAVEHCLGVDRKALLDALRLAACKAAKDYILGTKALVTVVEDGAPEPGVANLGCGAKAKSKLPPCLVLGPTPPDRVMWN